MPTAGIKRGLSAMPPLKGATGIFTGPFVGLKSLNAFLHDVIQGDNIRHHTGSVKSAHHENGEEDIHLVSAESG